MGTSASVSVDKALAHDYLGHPKPIVLKKLPEAIEDVIALIDSI